VRSVRSFSIDDRADVFSLKGRKDVLWMIEGVNDLELPYAPRSLQQDDHRSFDDEIVQVQLKELTG